jgi:hypothetical protein
MKKLIFALILLFINISFGQDTIRLTEVVVVKPYKKDYSKIIKKIRKTLKNNFEAKERNYRVNEISICDEKDTLLYIDALFNFNIKSLENNFTKNLVSKDDNKIFRDELFFNKYSEYRDSPEFWISSIMFRKSLNVLGFDFFKNYSKYEIEISYEKDIICVKFHSKEMYSGYLICDSKNYNLKKLYFKNPSEYPFSASHSDNGKKKGLKTWDYLIETTTIEFNSNNSNMIYVSNFTTNELKTNYFYEKYDKKGEIIFQEGPFSFDSTVKITEY